MVFDSRCFTHTTVGLMFRVLSCRVYFVLYRSPMFGFRQQRCHLTTHDANKQCHDKPNTDKTYTRMTATSTRPHPSAPCLWPHPVVTTSNIQVFALLKQSRNASHSFHRYTINFAIHTYVVRTVEKIFVECFL